MIPIIYAENETNFNHNGLGLLADTIYCNVDEVRNGSYELELAYPVNSPMYKEIKAKRWIKAKANDRFEPQLFRIYNISKPINGKVTVKAEHISYLLKDNFIEILNYAGNCNGALNALNSSATFPTGFTFYSNVTTSKNFTFDLRNFWECIIGKDDSIISRFGTGIDIVRNNKNISLLTNGGQDNNVLIAYRKNLTGFTLEEDWTNTITKIYPYATKDNNRIILTEKYVDSKYINRDPNPRVTAIDFTSYFEEGETITVDALRQKAIQYFLDTQCDIPTLNYNIEFVALAKTEEYKNFALNENISLLDQVIVRHELYGVDTKIKVVKTSYDSLAEKYLKIELGFVKNTITKTLKDMQKKQDDTNKKVDDTKKGLENTIEKTVNDLTITMKENDDSILLEVKNNKDNADTTFKLMDKAIQARVLTETFLSEIDVLEGEIELKVAKDKFSAMIELYYDSVAIAIKNATEMNAIFSQFGLTLKNGGLVVTDSSGHGVIDCRTDGILTSKYISVDDLRINNTGANSIFKNTLANMSATFQSISSNSIYYNGQNIASYVDDKIDDALRNYKLI
jgi:phage minor structural protein